MAIILLGQGKLHFFDFILLSKLIDQLNSKFVIKTILFIFLMYKLIGEKREIFQYFEAPQIGKMMNLKTYKYCVEIQFLKRLCQIDNFEKAMNKNENKVHKNSGKKVKGVQSDEDNQSDQIEVKREYGDQVQLEVKIENGQTPKKWYQMENIQIDDKKYWDYLEHHGVTFPPPYIPKKLHVSYNAEKVLLNADEEELAWYWCQFLGSEWDQNQIYRKNFSDQFMKRFLNDGQYTDFQKFDFTDIKLQVEKQREEKKNIPDQEKKKNKILREKNNLLYINAIVDGLIEKINGVVIQPPTLFKGRGEHPKAGVLKPRIQPEEITLNLARDAPIPKCPLPGHAWNQVVCKQDSTWLCSYKTDAINPSSAHKYIFLAANSKFKGMNDRKKYDKARTLKQKIFGIREDYYKMIADREIRKKQLGVATYLIDTLALRVGNEKGEDEADTVGCCSLRVQHIDVLPDNKIKLDFLGKDSMRYENIVVVKKEVWDSLQLFLRNKKPEDDLFDKIDAQALNDYLKSMMQGLTAKVFRTYNASYTLQKQLDKSEFQKQSTLEDKFEAYEHANRQVAILCNHQKTVSKKQQQSLKAKQKTIEAYRRYQTELEKHKSHFSAKKEKIDKRQIQVEIEGGKTFTMKFPDNKQATVSQIKKNHDRLIREQKNLKKRQENKQIAMGTSKTNYNDPRITVSWCKKHEVKIERIFTKNLLSKFLWAMYTDKDWTF